MPALLVTAFVFGLISMIFGQVLKSKIKFLRKAEEHSFATDFAADAAVSVGLGTLLGAGGTTLFMASIMAWLFGMPISAIKRRASKDATFKSEVSEYLQFALAALKFFKILLYIAIAPFWVAYKIHKWCQKLNASSILPDQVIDVTDQSKTPIAA